MLILVLTIINKVIIIVNNQIDYTKGGNMTEINKEVIAQKLKALRGDRSQKEVADACGITAMAISQYEQAERIPNDNIKIKLAAYYNSTVENIFFTN